MLAYPGFYRPRPEVVFVSETGSPDPDFAAANVLDTRQGKYWLVPSGGPHTVVLEVTFIFARWNEVCIYITSPAGLPMIGDVSVAFSWDTGAGVFSAPSAPYVLPKYTSALFRDQRILLSPMSSPSTGLWRIHVTAESGSAISRIALLHGTSSYYTEFDRYVAEGNPSPFERGWQSNYIEVMKSAANGRGGFFYSPDFESAPVRMRTLSGVAPMGRLGDPYVGLNGLVMRYCGFSREIAVLMHPTQHSGAESGKKLMHKHSLFGRRVNNITFNKESLTQHYSHNLQFKELV